MRAMQPPLAMRSCACGARRTRAKVSGSYQARSVEAHTQNSRPSAATRLLMALEQTWSVWTNRGREREDEHLAGVGAHGQVRDAVTGEGRRAVQRRMMRVQGLPVAGSSARATSRGAPSGPSDQTASVRS